MTKARRRQAGEGTISERLQRKRTKGYRLPPDAVYVGRPTRWGNPYRWTDYTKMLGRPGDEHHDVFDEHRRRHWAVTDFAAMLRDPRRAATAAFEAMLDHVDVDVILAYPSVEQIRAELAGRDLMCWCPLTDDDGQPVPCHADVLLAVANDRTHHGR